MSRKIKQETTVNCQRIVMSRSAFAGIYMHLTQDAPANHRETIWFGYFCAMKRIPVIVSTVLLVIACSSPDQSAKKEKEKEEITAEAKELMRLVDQYPDSTGLRIQLVNALDSAGALKAALVQMDSLIRRDSGNYGIWFHQAQLYEKAGDTLQALRTYDQAARIYPAPDALLSIANLLAERKDKRALSVCDEVESMRLGREYLAHTSFIKAVYFARIQDSNKALALLDQCIGNDYQYMEAYMEKGFIYFDRKDMTMATQIFEKAIEVRPTYADASYWLAKCFEQQGLKEKAITQYQRALVLDPDISEAKDALKRLGAA